MDPTELTFTSDGATLRGRLFLPSSTGPVPAVVMGHGFSATAHGMVADRYAEAFAAAGVAAFLYDHRGFGRSDGEPRGEINRWVQARDYRDAIGAIAALPQVDSQRIAIWGDSQSGAVVLAVAAVDDRVAAVVSQVPACGGVEPTKDLDGTEYAAMRALLLSGQVRAAPADWQGPMPVVSADQLSTPSALTPLTAFRWFIEYGGRFGTGWLNRIVRTETPEVEWSTTTWAAHVSVPTCFLIATDDEMPGSRTSVALTAFEALAGPKVLHELGGGHFGLLHHPGAIFDEAASVESRFLRDVLHPAT